MKLTLKKYEAAKKAVQELKVHQKTIRDWEEWIKKVGDAGEQRVTTINIDDKSGKITTECEPNGKPEKKEESC